MRVRQAHDAVRSDESHRLAVMPRRENLEPLLPPEVMVGLAVHEAPRLRQRVEAGELLLLSEDSAASDPNPGVDLLRKSPAVWAGGLRDA